MKKQLLKLVSFAVLVGIIASSCGKYEDGPGFTVLSKRMRLERSWDLDETVNAQGSSLKDNDSDYYTLKKDGVLEYTNDGTVTSGNWLLQNDNKNLKITVTYPIIGVVVIGDFEIKRLTKNELWLYNPENELTSKYKEKK